MAKSTKPKVDKVKKVNSPTVTEPIVEETKIETIPEPVIEEPEMVEVPPSVTLDEVKEVDNLVVTKVIPDDKEVVVSVPIEVLNSAAAQEHPPIKIIGKDISMEQLIIDFLNGRTGEIKMNDFLKSLFPIPAFGAPPTWNNQGASKLLKNTLDGMVREGKIKIKNDMHRRLATFYYPDNNSGKTEYHTIGSVSIIAQKVN